MSDTGRPPAVCPHGRTPVKGPARDPGDGSCVLLHYPSLLVTAAATAGRGAAMRCTLRALALDAAQAARLRPPPAADRLRAA